MATAYSNDQLLAMYCDLSSAQKDTFLAAIQNGARVGFSSVKPEVPATPTAQHVVTALLALGLVTQAAV